MKKILSVFFALAIIVTGCSGGSSSDDDKDTSNTDGEFPIVIEHAFGETTIEEKPERVVSIGWENQDVALALGVAPVAMSTPAYGLTGDETMRVWTKEKYDELDAEEPTIFNDLNELDFEAIEKANPDVILAAYSGITQEDYDMLSEIAPVIAYTGEPFVITWQEQIEQDSKGLGLEAEGKALIKELETMINDEVAKYPSLEGKTATFAWFDASDTSSFFVYGNADPRSKYLQDMGLELPSEVETVTDDAGGFFATISAEQAEILNDTDILVIYGGNEELLATLQADPILGKIPAIQNGSVVLLETDEPVTIAAATPTALSIPYAVEDYVKMIGEAAEKVK